VEAAGAPVVLTATAGACGMFIRSSTLSLICVVTSSIRCVSSPASDSASWLAASRSARALLMYA
jgi:hypothetical protein